MSISVHLGCSEEREGELGFERQLGHGEASWSEPAFGVERACHIRKVVLRCLWEKCPPS
jgi:hypothetical protein